MLKKLIILSGLSGSGNTAIMQELLDMNYLIISSLESNNYYKVIQNILNESSNEKIALFLEIQNEEQYSKNYTEICKLKSNKENLKIVQIFLNAQTNVLINRYQQNRKIHPYIQRNKLNIDIENAIKEEQKITNTYKKESDYIIDTSSLVVSEAQKLFKSYIEEDTKFVINLISFGFKHGMYYHSDFVFDVRSLPNPFYIPELRLKTGLDKEVVDYVFSTSNANELYNHILEIINLTIPGYLHIYKNSLNIAIACTGGQHRSVSFVERLASSELSTKYKVNIIHVERDRGHWHD